MRIGTRSNRQIETIERYGVNMPRVDFVVSTELERTPRVMQLESMFDVPAQQKLTHKWEGDIPLNDKSWNIGLIVGPSGAGKTTIAKKLFGERKSLKWKHKSIIDDFDDKLSIQEVTAACSAVGFNTIPSWMKPFDVLSTGEKFRAELARHLLGQDDPIVVDEFTSVVDRQVAHIGSNAVNKYIRKYDRKFVAVTCHYDVIEWLQPDWILEPATMTFRWRSVQRRPQIDIEIARVGYEAWKLFAPFHYLTKEMSRAASCFVLFSNGEPASFGGMLNRTHPKVNDIRGLSRLVTLPDYQGLGLAMILSDHLGACYKDLNCRMHTYPAHPSLVRAFDKSSNWALLKRPGVYQNPVHIKNTIGGSSKRSFGGRPCAIFEYIGHSHDNVQESRALLGIDK